MIIGVLLPLPLNEPLFDYQSPREEFAVGNDCTGAVGTRLLQIGVVGKSAKVRIWMKTASGR